MENRMYSLAETLVEQVLCRNLILSKANSWSRLRFYTWKSGVRSLEEVKVRAMCGRRVEAFRHFKRFRPIPPTSYHNAFWRWSCLRMQGVYCSK